MTPIASTLAIVMAVTAPSGGSVATTESELQPESRERYDKAQKLLGRKKYEEAAAEYSRAYAIEPAPFLLYMQGAAEQLAGNCTVAIRLFEKFIAARPTELDYEAAARQIEACEGVPPPFPEPEPELEHKVDPLPEPEGPRDDEQPRRPAARDPLAHALTWPGLAVAGIGAGLLIESHRRRRLAESSSLTEGEHQNLLRPAVPMSRAGIALVSIGGAALVAGIIRFAVVARSSNAASESDEDFTVHRRARLVGTTLIVRW